MRSALLLFIFLGFCFFATAGENKKIHVMNFDEFEHWLAKETDSIYVINFWATWCAPCIREIPAFEKLNANYRDQKVKVLLVSLDFPNQMDSRLVPFVEKNNMQSQVLLLDDHNANRWIPLVSEEWTGAIPATVIYNKNFRRFYQREFKYEELEEIILPLLN
jgi:thiol-disulfide isomerase/thioredoxin